MAEIASLQGDVAGPFYWREGLMSVSLYLCWNKNAISVEIFVLITDLFLEPITVPDIPGQIFQRGIPQSPAWSGSGRV